MFDVSHFELPEIDHDYTSTISLFRTFPVPKSFSVVFVPV